ncbi:MAG TPA: hypothetical protein VKV19_19260 [Ktedonobacteraceae bacterium]|nr:hypothetical protein [Ktedonobacteraceae bacterium]
MPQNEDWLITDEMAKDVRVNVRTVRNWISSGDLAAIDVESGHRKDDEDFVNRRRIDKGRKG